MIDKNKLVGASLMVLAIALTGSAAMADRGARMGGDPMGMGGQMGMGGPMQAFDFAAVDADKDGKVTLAEIEAYRAAQAKAMDTDGDGLMSEAELVAMEVTRATERATARVKMMLERQDADKDGKLSAAEMLQRPMPTMMIDRLDADKDGAVTEAEIAAAQAQMANGPKDRGGRGDRGKMRGHGHFFGRD